ncbi:MAG: endonuclease/exonuclease/phosphatase family protein [Patescibacteria group bacterium]|jgi:endonuclease/exonuclease/phosphatase family metal-dependent hydrolase
MKIKIINLNLWLGGQHTWDNILEYLRHEDPDIIFLQEVNNSTKKDVPPYLTSYASLQRELNLPYSEYETQFNVKYGDEYVPRGVAIFSRFPLSNKFVVWLYGNVTADVDDSDIESIPTFPRNLLHCQTEINNTRYNLMTLQGVWAHDGRETEAQKQMGQKIVDYVADKENVILGGDFNVNEKTESIKFLGKHLTNVFKSERVTSFNMARKNKPGYGEAVVDFIFLGPTIKVVSHYSSDKDVSDHQSQVVIIEV